MKLYFGNTVTTVTTIMILVLLGFIGESIVTNQISITGDAGVCFCWHTGLLYAVSQRPEMDLIRQFRIQLTEVVCRAYSHWSVSLI